ncbi:hypothetical protein EV122DRAFT_273463 [Schizophyllum commune]
MRLDRHPACITRAMLTSKRLQLKAFADDDYVRWINMRKDIEHQTLVSDDLVVPRTSLSMEELRRQVNDDKTYMLYLSIMDTSAIKAGFAGFVSATKPNARSRQSFLNIVIHKRHRWLGYETEAVQAVIKHCSEVNVIHRVSLSVSADNHLELEHYKEL